MLKPLPVASAGGHWHLLLDRQQAIPGMSDRRNSFKLGIALLVEIALSSLYEKLRNLAHFFSVPRVRRRFQK